MLDSCDMVDGAVVVIGTSSVASQIRTNQIHTCYTRSTLGLPYGLIISDGLARVRHRICILFLLLTPMAIGAEGDNNASASSSAIASYDMEALLMLLHVLSYRFLVKKFPLL
jgi:hypothetical protein